MATTPNAYIVVELDVFDPETFQQYREAVEPIILAHGGCYRVRGGETVPLEGDPPLKRVILLEFPSIAAARGFMNSDEYKPVAELRFKSAHSRIYMVEGYLF